jgi:hypothetical protein
MFRQGECLFVRIESNDAIDDGFRPVAAENGLLIIGHSETGHHHVIEMDRSPSAELLISQSNEFIGLLKLGESAEVKHLRDFDQHAPVHLPAGDYRVRYRREFTPAGLRRVMD